MFYFLEIMFSAAKQRLLKKDIIYKIKEPTMPKATFGMNRVSSIDEFIKIEIPWIL